MAATDTSELAHPQKLLAHKNREMTGHYVEARMREGVKPLECAFKLLTFLRPHQK